MATNEKAISIISIRGKHDDSLFWLISPTRNKICYQVVHIFTISEWMISENKAILDDLALMYQLGVVEAANLNYENCLKEWKGVR